MTLRRGAILVLGFGVLLAGIWLIGNRLKSPAPAPIRIVTEVALTAGDTLPELQLYSIAGELVGDSAVYNRAIFMLDEGRDLELRTDRVYGGWKLEIALAESYAVLRRGTEQREYHYPEANEQIPWLVRRLRYNPTRKHAFATLQQLGPRVKPYLREMLDSTATCSRESDDYYMMDHLPDRDCDLAALLIAEIDRANPSRNVYEFLEQTFPGQASPPAAAADTRTFWGYYRDNGSLSGEDLYLFPDGQFIQLEWADISPRSIVDQGRWRWEAGMIALISDGKLPPHWRRSGKLIPFYYDGVLKLMSAREYQDLRDGPQRWEKEWAEVGCDTETASAMARDSYQNSLEDIGLHREKPITSGEGPDLQAKLWRDYPPFEEWLRRQSAAGNESR